MIECGPLADFVANVNCSHIGLLVLDVEGAKSMVVYSIDFDELSINVLQIKDDKLYQQRLGYDLNRLGFAKLHHLIIDSCLYSADRL